LFRPGGRKKEVKKKRGWADEWRGEQDAGGKGVLVEPENTGGGVGVRKDYP